MGKEAEKEVGKVGSAPKGKRGPEFLGSKEKKGEVMRPAKKGIEGSASYQQVTSKLEEHDIKPDKIIIMSKDRLQQILVNPIIVNREENPKMVPISNILRKKKN